MNAVVLVPWRSGGCEHREAAWRHVRRMWADRGLLVMPADDAGDPFSRSCSINLAHDMVAASLDPDVYLIADADVIVSERQAIDAIDQAAADPGLVVAFDRYCYLTELGTTMALDGERRQWWKHLQFVLNLTVSSCVAVSRETWDTVGGFDPRFRAWGSEDVAFEVACATLAGPTRWVHGDAHHLYHPTEENRPATNPEMLAEYLALRDDPAAMRAHIDGIRQPA